MVQVLRLRRERYCNKRAKERLSGGGLDVRLRCNQLGRSISILGLLALIGVGAACGGSGGSDQPETAEIPNVVGMNLQDAQDCLQSKGFYYLDDQPAPGEPRFQVNDSNWTVTRQSDVGPGYSFDTRITLTARKDGGYSSKSCP